jgi:hypothetical protein
MDLAVRRGLVGRRAFVRDATTTLGAGLLGSVQACLPSPVRSRSRAATSPAAMPAWDMSWVQRLSGRHGMVFDSPEISGGAVLFQVRSWIRGYREAEGVVEHLQPVLVIRHAAVPMVLNDAMWSRLDIGGLPSLRQRPENAPFIRNPFINYVAGASRSLIGPNDGLDRQIANGAIVLACGQALEGFAFRLREREGLSRDEATALILSNVIVGAVVMPNGVYAVGRAQQAGCHYFRAT